MKRMGRSKFRIVETVCYLEVYNVKGSVVGETMIDTEDYDKIKEYRFHKANVSKHSEYFRVKTNDNQYLHRLIVGKPQKGLYIDHINRNTLDNRKCNLRFVTPSQNGMNRTRYKNKTSKYKGVHWDKSRKKWKVEIKLNQVCRHIGRFDNEIDAVMAYNEKAKELFGEYAVLNIGVELLLTVLRLDIDYVKRNLFKED